MNTPSRIMTMASAFYDSCVLFAAADLGIFDALAARPDSDAETLAAELNLDSRGLRLLMDAAVALDLLEKTGENYRNAADTAMFLVRGAPGDLSGAIHYNRDVYATWGRLADLARTGRPVERPAIHLGEDPDRTRTFVLSMHARALGIGRALVPQLKLGPARTLLDVGGGPGTFSVLLAKAYADLACTVLDLPAVTAIAGELIAGQGMQDRVRTLPGNYRDLPFPDGYDAVLFCGVLHQESPDSIRRLLRKAFGALRPGGTVYVVDMMTDSTRAQPRFSALFAVNMALTADDGWVFSDRELKTWLGEAGFEQIRIEPLPPPLPHGMASAVRPCDDQNRPESSSE